MDDNDRRGATLDEWMLFDVIMGLTEDLLPVVSNTKAVISAASKIKQLGKTPSTYNKRGEAAGIANWTSKMSTSAEVDAWSEVNDYGICLQTRRVRAIDIDVEDAYDVAAIMEVVAHYLPGAPLRWRANSGKCLIAFWYEGDLPKHVVPVEDGIIELLADGQQFIAAGEHVSGVRYEWSWSGGEGGLPVLPELSREAIHNMMCELELMFSTAPMRIAGARRRLAHLDGNVTPSNGTNPQTVDPTAAVLEAKALSIGRDGEVYIVCPFKGEHTGDSGETTTVYFPAGTRGYEAGHFKCLHAHCAGRSDEEFMEALDVIGAQFEVLGDGDGDGDGFANLPSEAILKSIGAEGGLITGDAVVLDNDLNTNEDGRILASVENIHAVLMRPDLCGNDIRYDTFRDEIVYKPWPHDKRGWRALKDVDYTRLRSVLARTGFNPISREMIRDVVHWVATIRVFDTANEWIDQLQWDGVGRIRSFLHHYMGAEDSPYSSAVSEYMWVALAGRCVEPGCKADAAPIFIGAQGVGKSMAVAAIAPDVRYHAEIRFDEHEDNLSRKIRGKLIAEFAEMRGFQTKEAEAIKAFIVRQYEEWVPKYMEFSTLYPRRLIFIGTSNKDEIFNDETGERRWLPTHVNNVDIEGIKRDRDQLWAEARDIFAVCGIRHFYNKANILAADTRGGMMIFDPWEDIIERWLDAPDIDGICPRDVEYLTIVKVMSEALGMDSKNMKTFEAMRIGKILRKMGFEKSVLRKGKTIFKVWISSVTPK